MLELAVIVLRLVQYGAASILAGSALFFVYALPANGPHSASALRWPKPLLAVSALVLTAAALLGFGVQTALMAGSIAEGVKLESLVAVLTGMSLGKAAVVRAALACAAAVALMIATRGPALWVATGSLGALATATFGWMGHGAATEGDGRWVHLAADILHALAAAGWVGALVAFVFLVLPREQTPERLRAVGSALRRFSLVGIVLVTVLVATGLANSWFLIGNTLGAAASSNWGQVLALKLTLFLGMIALAVLHRQRSVPALERNLASGKVFPNSALGSLRRSVLLEAALGVSVLAVVAWLGMLPPPAAG